MLRNKEDVKNIVKTLVILTIVVMTGCGSATPQTSENTSVNTDAVQAEKLTPEKNKDVSTTKGNSESSNKKNEDSKNEDKENTSDDKQSLENEAKGNDGTQSQSASKQADPVPSTPTLKQDAPSASSSSATKSQTCKTIHHDAQYETILHPAETHNEQVEHPATGHFEDVPITKEVGYIVCGCGEMFTSAEEYGKHSDPLVLSGDYIHGSYYTTSKTETVGYEKKWVQDTPAYITTETVVDKEQWTENKLVKAAYDESICQ